jgi:zinc protease
MAHWRLQEALYPMPHPYHWMTIGSQEDLDAASLDDVKDFFRRFYSPSNASLAIAGDFQRDQAMDLINRYFGDLPPGPELPRKGRFDSGLAGRVEMEMRDKVSLPRLYIAWPTPPDLDEADAPLEFLQAILSDGITSRLHRSLVYEKQIAQSALIRYHPSEIAGLFVIQVTAADGHGLAEVEAATDAELERLWREPPTDEEMTRIKNRISAAHFRQLTRIGGFGGRADQLNHFNIFGRDPGLINSILDRYLAVRREDILRVGQTVLNHRQVRLRVLPEDTFQPAAATAAVDRASMPQPVEEPSFTPPKPSHLRLANGLGITVVEQPRLPIVAFALMVRAGATTDPVELPGLASFTAQMLVEGTSSRSSQEIAAAFEFLGARISIEVGREHTLLVTETMSKDWPTALEMMAGLVKHPTFPEHELERVRREELTDLRRSKDDPTAVAARLVSGLMFNQDTGYGHPIHGTEAAVGSLSRDDVMSHFRRAYNPASATLIVAGDVTLAAVKEQAEAALGDWQAASEVVASPIPASDGTAGDAAIYLVDRPGAAQSVIWALQTTIPRQHSDYLGLVLLNSAFGGQFEARLNLNLRQEKGYSYGYHSYVQWHHGPSLLLAGGSVHTAVTKESVSETLREFHDLHTKRPISQKELEEAKAGMLRAYPAGFERPGQVLGQLIQLALYDLPDDYFQTVRSRVRAVSLAEVQRIGSERILPDHLKVLVVGDRLAVEPGLRDLGLPVVLLDDNGAEL